MWTLLRDIASFVGGWILIFMEVSRPEVREAVLIFAASVTTVPGVAVGATSIVEAIARHRDGTGGSPSVSAEPPVSQSS